jgi:hypothetical protein
MFPQPRRQRVVTIAVAELPEAYRRSSVFTGSLMAVRVMHCLALKPSAVFGWMLATRGKSASIALAKVIMMIDVPIEMFRPMEPWSCTDEHSV